ncbi:sperm nuclear basic protein PL-I isoform PLIb [Rhodotorula diobovata]|uniref:Sperm nuclear basic protein PL-I isoform PLIb n=1 Tax=Rhodotorula diobovata TaxID=5288 RepID=A0A5C5FZA1_9BASI|nr:sperm nuclear basic protein PL-I isoform PLIb [Rhodotorula diobovata]
MIVSGSSRLLRSAARPSCAACGPSLRRSAHKLVAVQLTTDSLPSLGALNQVVALSPGLARNRLVPAGLAIYVGRDGEGVSVRRDMERRGRELARGEEGRRRARDERARGVLEAMSGAVDDPLAPARASERALLSSLTTLAAPSSPLVFTRLTTSPTSSDLFGSVSTADVVSALRDRGVVAAANAGDAASGSGSPIQGAFREGQDGVLNGRVKRVGEFVFEVELKTLGDKVPVVVQVAREDNKAGSA